MRELIQNAIDAVREREHWPLSDSAAEVAWKELDEHNCDILVKVSETNAGNWLQVTDRGVGMTPDTIRHYFLRVGASLRQSADWLKQFPLERQAHLLRSGRFGIGTLAAFLLGAEVRVTTRHVTETDGIGTEFVVRLSDEPIELRRVPASIGTCITIPLSEEVFQTLVRAPEKWDWFSLRTPRVVRIVETVGRGSKVIAPAVAESDEALARMPWRRLPFAGLDRVLWRPGSGAHQRLWCNGLLVESKHETIYNRRYVTGGRWILEVADVMVFDGAANLPLTVSRDRLAERAPYHDELIRDFLLDHCAWLLARASLPRASRIPAAPMWEHYDAMSPGDGTLVATPYLEVTDGIMPWSTAAIATSGIDIVVAHDGLPTEEYVEPLPNLAIAFIPITIYGGFGGESRTSIVTRPLRDFARAVVPAQTVEVVTTYADDPKLFDEIGTVDGRVWRSGDARSIRDSTLPLLQWASDLARRHGAGVVAFAKVDPRGRNNQDALDHLWTELELPSIIPRDPVLRSSRCATALKLLDDRINLHLAAMERQR